MYTGYIGYPESGCDYTFTRPLLKGRPTKATTLLMDIYAYSKINHYFSRSELLRKINRPDSPGYYNNFWRSATNQGFIKSRNKKIYPGKNLEDYLKLHNLI